MRISDWSSDVCSSDLWLWLRLLHAGRRRHDDHQRRAHRDRDGRDLDAHLLCECAGPQTLCREEEVETETQAGAALRLLRFQDRAGPLYLVPRIVIHQMAGLSFVTASFAVPPQPP